MQRQCAREVAPRRSADERDGSGQEDCAGTVDERGTAVENKVTTLVSERDSGKRRRRWRQ